MLQKDRMTVKKFKEYNPDGIVVYGGPNVPEENLDECKRSYVN